MRRVAVLGIAAAVLAVDQLTKLMVLRSLDDGRVVTVVGRFLTLQLIDNPGAAFSIGSGKTWILTLVALLISLMVLREIWRGVSHRGWAITLGVLLGGAVGNLVDRAIRPPGFGRGHVVDFINYNGFFIGNVADIAIVGAAMVLALLSIRDVPMRRVVHPDEVTR